MAAGGVTAKKQRGAPDTGEEAGRHKKKHIYHFNVQTEDKNSQLIPLLSHQLNKITPML